MLPTRNYVGIDPAITQRPVSSAILGVDSDDRFDTAAQSRLVSRPSPYNFTIDKKSSIMNGFFTRIGVTEFNMAWAIPNINRKTNFINVRYNVGAGPVDALLDIPIGFYNPSQLATAIQTAVRALNVGLAAFTMVYGIIPAAYGGPSKMPVFSYATNNAATIAFSALAPGSSDALGLGVLITPSTRQLFDVLGFSTVNSVLSVDGIGSTTFAQGIRYIDIVCTQLTNNQALKDNTTAQINRDMLARIYIVDPGSGQSTVDPSSATFCPPGCAPMTIYRDFTSPKYIQWLPNQPVPGVLKFEVYADDGSSVEDFYPSAVTSTDWALTMLVSEN